MSGAAVYGLLARSGDLTVRITHRGLRIPFRNCPIPQPSLVSFIGTFASLESARLIRHATIGHIFSYRMTSDRPEMCGENHTRFAGCDLLIRDDEEEAPASSLAGSHNARVGSGQRHSSASSTIDLEGLDRS